jgi:hypothetical protein
MVEERVLQRITWLVFVQQYQRAKRGTAAAKAGALRSERGMRWIEKRALQSLVLG